MILPVIIEPLADRSGFAARLAAPIDLSAEAPTAAEAHERLAALLKERLQQGAELRSLTVPFGTTEVNKGGWLADDELTQEWREHVRRYRAECDAADRATLDDAAVPAEEAL